MNTWFVVLYSFASTATGEDRFSDLSHETFSFQESAMAFETGLALACDKYSGEYDSYVFSLYEPTWESDIRTEFVDEPEVAQALIEYVKTHVQGQPT